jgi:hypothetical protein
MQLVSPGSTLTGLESSLQETIKDNNNTAINKMREKALYDLIDVHPDPGEQNMETLPSGDGFMKVQPQ